MGPRGSSWAGQEASPVRMKATWPPPPPRGPGAPLFEIEMRFRAKKQKLVCDRRRKNPLYF